MQGGEQAEGHLVVGEEDGGDLLAAARSGRRAAARRRSPTTASSPRAGSSGTGAPAALELGAPARRCGPRASCESAGPATWCTVRCPRSSRWRVARRAPVSWSTPTAGRSSSPPTWTATSGTGGSSALQRLGRVVVGAQRDDRRRPRWATKRSTASRMAPGRRVVQDRDAQRVAGRAGRLLQPEHRLRRPVLVDLDRDQADGAGRPGDQRPGRDVGPVAELGDRLLDPLPACAARRSGGR